MPRLLRTQTSASSSSLETDPITGLFALTMLRLIIGTGAEAHLANESTSVLEQLLNRLGISADPKDFATVRELKGALEKQRQILESAPISDHNPLLTNAANLGNSLGLDETEVQLLAFLALEEEEEDAAQPLLATARTASRRDVAHLLGLALNCPEESVRRALHPDGTLLRAGLVVPERRGPVNEGSGLELLRGLGSTLLTNSPPPDELLRSYYRPAPAPALAVDDFPHLAADLTRLTRLLASAAECGEAGVNILLYGPPGTGKTELARLAAHQAGLTSLEINHETAGGIPLEPSQRQRAYQLCQHLTSRDRTAAILFDEVEDISAPTPSGLLRNRAPDPIGGKATLNNLLETNPVPALWITNDPHPLDTAHLRRFAWVIEVGVPPRSVRRRILAGATAELPVSDEWLDRNAAIEGLTPADADRAARTARLAAGEEPAEVEACLEEHFQRQGRLQGRRPTPQRRGAEALPFTLNHLNPDPAIEPVLDDLSEAGDGTALLHGPPGTGKTALAHHLAERTDRPLISRPASAILSPWVGQTEANLAALFREAAADGAVLLLDEADSLLAGRGMAQAEWEVTRTNELLVQIETFPGILLCATNRLEALDDAALRRFDHKVHLRALNPDQRRALFADLLAALGADFTEPGKALDDLDNLTPGDFATLARRHSRRVARTGQAPDPDGLLRELERESRAKPGGGRRVGFI